MSGVYRIFHPDKTGKLYGRRAGVMWRRPQTQAEIIERGESRKARKERAKELEYKPRSAEHNHLRRRAAMGGKLERRRADRNDALAPEETFLDREEEE
tara:strand:+ start:1006 stop:1299 length:294 start_codon:yes stop_codon:yes gene_type:complete